ncbi:hypothetical protein E2C01_052390 [Portunus trituberculatus]|uniref:Uncharacterized protein n=1 Tax=Portunus trituberculatus TaxID=210409 RepID=A0A5B7GLF0_PORTR|nr:hypothetical protein [Portunus trituberculatus]
MVEKKYYHGSHFSSAVKDKEERLPMVKMSCYCGGMAVRSSGSEGVEVSGAVPLGTRLTLVVSAYSRDLPLDLHLAKCEARDEEGRVVVLLKDGCSVSQVLEDFREVVEAAGEPGVRRVSQYAKLRVFNTRAAPQNITLLCFLKVNTLTVFL